MAILDNCYWRTENSQNNKLGKRTAHLAVHWPVNLMFRKVFSLLALLAVVALSSRADTAAEYQVKAAFLYNFAKFVDWPPKAFPQADSPIVLGVMGEDPFGEDLERTITGQTVNGHPFVIKRFNDVQSARGCHMLFVSSSERKRLPEILTAVRDQNTLTVADNMDQFTASGGIINFIQADNKIRFEINADAARRAELKLSSRLLSLAKVIRDSKKGT